jgi:hypothetical protein
VIRTCGILHRITVLIRSRVLFDLGVKSGWWISSVAQYQGHEERLPIDGHGVMALIAPRAAAIADAWEDHEGCLTFADEANVVASTQVYSLLGAEDRLRLIHRPGDHHGFDDVNTCALPQGCFCTLLLLTKAAEAGQLLCLLLLDSAPKSVQHNYVETLE